MQSQRNKPDWKSVTKALKGAPTFTKRTAYRKTVARHPFKPVPEMDALWARAYK